MSMEHFQHGLLSSTSVNKTKRVLSTVYLRMVKDNLIKDIPLFGRFELTHYKLWGGIMALEEIEHLWANKYRLVIY